MDCMTSIVDLVGPSRIAVALTGGEFSDKLNFIANAWLPARELVVSALNCKKVVHPSGRILIFERACPWKVKYMRNSLLVLVNRHAKNFHSRAIFTRTGTLGRP